MNPTLIAVLAILGAVTGCASVILHVVAPRTKNTWDDKLAKVLDELKEMISKITPAALVLLLVGAIVASSLAACGSWWSSGGKAEVSAGGRAGALCAIDDIAKYGADVRAALAKDGFRAALHELAHEKGIGQDVVTCVVQAIVAGLAAQPSTSQGTSEPSVVYLHGRAYLADPGGAS